MELASRMILTGKVLIKLVYSEACGFLKTSTKYLCSLKLLPGIEKMFGLTITRSAITENII